MNKCAASADEVTTCLDFAFRSSEIIRLLRRLRDACGAEQIGETHQAVIKADLNRAIQSVMRANTEFRQNFRREEQQLTRKAGVVRQACSMGEDELCHCRRCQSRPRFSNSPCATTREKSRTNTRSHSQGLNPRTRSKNFPVKSLKRSAALRISAVLSQRKPTPIGKQSPITCLYWRKTFCA